jgi:hypothetical protein
VVTVLVERLLQIAVAATEVEDATGFAVGEVGLEMGLHKGRGTLRLV